MLGALVAVASGLSHQEWRARAHNHREVLAPFIAPFLERRARGELHPVYDFLFSYYSFAPAKLLAWHPSAETVLEPGDGDAVFSEDPNYELVDDCWRLNLSRVPQRIVQEAGWICELGESVANRPGRYGCFGLHEWAMLYRTKDVRHSHPLRISAEVIADVCESHTIVCSHYDAFRFFSPQAVSLNQIAPSRDTRLQNEQSGCLHANMDLYKWSYKLAPWIGSDLVRESFLLAVAAREIDMRASPYDLAALGFAPICLETDEGKSEYVREQVALSKRAEPVRRVLTEAARSLAALPLQ